LEGETCRKVKKGDMNRVYVGRRVKGWSGMWWGLKRIM